VTLALKENIKELTSGFFENPEVFLFTGLNNYNRHARGKFVSL
jgi:hypothetical protein